MERATSQVIEESHENVFFVDPATPRLDKLLCKVTPQRMFDGTGATGWEMCIGALLLSMLISSRSSREFKLSKNA